MTPADLQGWKELCSRATPGPWLVSHQRRCVDTGQLAADGAVYDGVSWVPLVDGDDDHETGIRETATNGEFIAAAREAVPALIAEVERLRAEVGHLRTCLATANANHERFERLNYLSRDELEAMRGMVREMLATAHPRERDHPTMFRAWARAHAMLEAANK